MVLVHAFNQYPLVPDRWSATVAYFRENHWVYYYATKSCTCIHICTVKAVNSDHPRVVVVKRVTHACQPTTSSVISGVVGMFE